jgi:tetratricopeptide (TPR) repeat protein
MKPWADVRKKCPASSEKIYTAGEEILKNNIEYATAANKDAAIQELLKLYDDYDKSFPKNTAGNSVKKAMVLHKNKLGKPEEIYALLDNSFQRHPEAFTDANTLYVYFDLFFNQYKTGTTAIKPETVFLKQYAVQKQMANASKMAAANDKRGFGRASSGIDRLVSGMASCENLVPFYDKNFEQHKSDTLWLEKAAHMLREKNCVTDPLFLKLSEASHAVQATAASAYNLGVAAYKSGKKDKAVDYFNESAQLARTADEKANTYYAIASTVYNSDNKAKAKEYAYKALEAKPSFAKSYLFLAQLYSNAGKECGGNAFEQKAIFFLAGETARKAGIADPKLKAGADKMAAKFRMQGPTEAEIKAAKMEGKTVAFKCWVNESVAIPKF